MFWTTELDINYDKIVECVLSVADKRMPDRKTLNYQIAVQCRKGVEDFEKQLKESTNSLYLDWDNFDPNTMDKPALKPKSEWLQDNDFTETVELFKDTEIEELNKYVVKRYNACRGRIMNLPVKTTLSWHHDYSKRLHIPIKINEGSFMVVEDKVCRFEVGKAYTVDTTLYHTAVNAHTDNRIHLVYCI